MPRLGGVAVFSAATLALLLVTAARLAPAVEFWDVMRPIAIGAVTVFLLGLIDDIAGLPPWTKLIVQSAAAFVVMESGLLIERVTVAGEVFMLGPWSWPVTLVWIVGLTNAFNLIDGLDGLAAGVTVIAGTTCAAILVARGHAPDAMLLAALVGAALGFLVYNFAPATIFLGDSGSLLFGFVLATTAITGWQKGATALAAGVPLLIFALPIADAATTLFRRARRRADADASVAGIIARILEPDRRHIHHRLQALGLSTRTTVVVLYIATIVLSALALATARFD